MKRAGILFSLLLLAGASISFVVVSISPNEILTQLTDKLNDFRKNRPQEKVYLHFDKPYYAAGDEMWFKAYLVNASSNSPSTLSNIVYVELIDGLDKTVKQLILSKETGNFNGSFKLNDTLPEGNYRVRAYTNWMRNLGEDFFFVRNFEIGNVRLSTVTMTANFVMDSTRSKPELMAEITFTDNINQPIKNKEVDHHIILVGRNGTRGKAQTDQNGRIRVPIPNSNNPSHTDKRIAVTINYDGQPFTRDFYLPYYSNELVVDFFPEGGDLVSGLSSNVAFKSSDELGNPVEISGFIQDVDGNKITSINSTHQGIGKFTFLPQSDSKYQAVITKRDGTLADFDLPEALSNGALINIIKQEQDKITLAVKVSRSYFEENPNVLLIGQSRNVPYYSSAINLRQNVQMIEIPTEYFPDGITQFTLFNSAGLPMSERLVFIQPTDFLAFDISTPKTNYLPRENVEVAIQVGKGNSPQNGEYSVAVTDDNYVNYNGTEQNIVNYLLFSSDLKGQINNPGQYFLPDGSNNLDLIMLTNGWRRFTWTDILKPSLARYEYDFEKDLSFTGRVRDMSEEPMANAQISGTTNIRGAKAITAVSDSKGYFTISGFNFPDSTRLIIQARTPKGGRALYIDMNESFAEIRAKRQLFNPNVNQRIAKYTRANQEEFAYERGKLGLRPILLGEVTIVGQRISRSSSFGGTADAIITRDEIIKYASGGNLLSALRGRVPGLQIVGNRVVIRNVTNRGNFTDPLVIVDGSYATDASILSQINPNDVESIEVLKSASNLSMYGNRGGNGVIIVNTKRGQYYNGPIQRRGMLNYYPIGYHEAREFYQPKYENDKVRNSAAPDLRTTLFWDGNLKPDANGVITFWFYASDRPTTYSVVVEGVTEEGKVGRAVGKISRK